MLIDYIENVVIFISNFISDHIIVQFNNLSKGNCMLSNFVGSQPSKELQKMLELKSLDKNTNHLFYSKNMQLGKGAFGQVFLGYSQNQHRPFACKIISFSKLQGQPDSIMKKIKQEIVNMQIAKNEKIIELFQTKMSPNHIYILCEYCNGENMQIYLKKRSYLTETQSIGFFKEILQGFYQLRQRNIVHRDMKLANLLLHNYSIKIADLGFSKSIQNHEQLLQSIVGSPAYMSPQILQKEMYTQKTDIWSLGIILYEMLYGHNPFSNCANILQLKQSIKKEISFPKYPYVSCRTKQTLKKMLKVKQHDRISWQLLFSIYLINPQIETKMQQQTSKNNEIYTMSPNIYNYFRKSYFIESYLHLNKIMSVLCIYKKQQLQASLPRYDNKIQFFIEEKYIKQNKIEIYNHFNYYLQYRNEISYLMIVNDKLTKTIQHYQDNIEYATYAYCLIMLNYRYSITLIQELINIPKQNTQHIKIKIYYEALLNKLLLCDHEILEKEYQQFYQYFFVIFTENLQKVNSQLADMVQNDLSGIYNNSKGDIRVIKFFINNYMKKTFNFLKEIIPKEQKGDHYLSEQLMIPQEESPSQRFQEIKQLPTNQFTVLKLINEYLSNSELFSLKIQQANKRQTLSVSTFRKNLNQILFDFQNIMSLNYQQELFHSVPFKEQSINWLINKEFKWNSFIFNKIL